MEMAMKRIGMVELKGNKLRVQLLPLALRTSAVLLKALSEELTGALKTK